MLKVRRLSILSLFSFRSVPSLAVTLILVANAEVFAFPGRGSLSEIPAGQWPTADVAVEGDFPHSHCAKCDRSQLNK